MRIYIDMETRSTVDIWTSGAWRYATHPSTQILCIAYAFADSPIQILREGSQDLIEAAHNPEILFHAHNAFFEQCIWEHILVKQYGYPQLPVHRWRCTSAKACAYGLPKSLEKAAQALKLPVTKDLKGRQIMLRMCKPLPSKTGEITYDNSPEHFKILEDYCKQDVEVERRIDKTTPDLLPQEQIIWECDQRINMRGVRVDIPTVQNCIRILNKKTQELNTELSQLTNGYVTKGTQTVAMVKYLQSQGVDIDSVNKESVKKAIKEGKLSPHHLQVLRLRQQLGKSSLAKYRRLIDSVDENHILRDCFMYHGASSTGRWSGKLVQLQNLPKGRAALDVDKTIDIINKYTGSPLLEMLFPQKVMDTLSACIRGMFIPTQGKEFYVVDYNAIEARVLMWLAEETKGLYEFSAADRGEEEDIYVQMACRIYRDSNLTKKNKQERMLGKQTILGCGYGMSGKKFAQTCNSYGIVISETEATQVVNLYRQTYSSIVQFWYSLEHAMMAAYATPNTIIPCKKIRWVYLPKQDTMHCQLPSGRFLTYHSPKIVQNRFGSQSMSFKTEVTSQWVRRDVYGGLLTENCCQAIARDIMAYSMPELEKNGFPILMHTHDEIVSERPKGEQRLNEMIEIMCTLPDWAKGCPIVAEGFTCERYKKG